MKTQFRALLGTLSIGGILLLAVNIFPDWASLILGMQESQSGQLARATDEAMAKHELEILQTIAALNAEESSSSRKEAEILQEMATLQASDNVPSSSVDALKLELRNASATSKALEGHNLELVQTATAVSATQDGTSLSGSTTNTSTPVKDEHIQDQATVSPVAAEPDIVKPETSVNVIELSLTICDDNGCNISLWNFADESIVDLVFDEGSNFGTSWSPDGSQFVFASNRSEVWQLYIYDLNKGQIVDQITHSKFDSTWPSWSPNGNTILYQESTNDTKNGSKIHIWKVDLSTRDRVKLTDEGTNKAAKWSPTGKQIVFSSARRHTHSHTGIDNHDEHYLYIMDDIGENLQQVTNESNVFDTMPMWMPDGKHIIFTRYDKGNKYEDNGPGNLFFFNIETNKFRGLTFTSSDESQPIISLLGDYIAYRSVLADGNTGPIYMAKWDGEDISNPVFIADASHIAWRPK